VYANSPSSLPGPSDDQAQEATPGTTMMLSHANLVAHEKKLVCKGDTWHHWHAVREHKERRQRDIISSYPPAFPATQTTCSLLSKQPKNQTGESERLGPDKRQVEPTAGRSSTVTDGKAAAQTQEQKSISFSVDMAKRGQKERKREKTRKVEHITPADIMARWNLADTGKHTRQYI